MMKNKIKLKKYLVLTIIVSFFLLIISITLNIYEYHIYTVNFNNKISALVSKIEEKYQNISENEIMEILNNKEINAQLLNKYSIDITKDNIIINNENHYHKFLVLNISFFITTIIILVFIFLKYNKIKDKEISEITKYIEEINHKNYTLHIDKISEDELSILKNEIYKTTVMLKENAENSLKDKKELKKSLEDISHQLKNPLTSILIMLDNLIDDPNMEPSIQEEFIRDIKREVININFLVQSILKISKFDSNTITFNRKQRFIKDIIKESIKNISTLCDLKDIKIEITGNENSTINCDFRWQVEAITNILKNCVEHSENGQKIIINYEQNNIYSSIIVKDFGDEIPKEDLPHIFERFYKGKNATIDSIGIGLSLSKTIIEKDNGKITVESNPSVTTFNIKYFS